MRPETEIPSLDTETLWRQFHDELLSFVRGRVGSDAVAQDLLQNAFLRAHKRLLQGDQPSNPRAWLYQIARNLIIDGKRHARRQLALAEEVARDWEPDTLTPAETSEAFSVIARALPGFIDDLEPMYRDALRMTELEGLTQKEAAERSQVSLSGMKSRVQRGRQRLFARLQRCCKLEVDARGRMMAFTPHRTGKECC